MDSSVSLENRIWFLRICHHVPFSLYLTVRHFASLYIAEGHNHATYSLHATCLPLTQFLVPVEQVVQVNISSFNLDAQLELVEFHVVIPST